MTIAKAIIMGNVKNVSGSQELTGRDIFIGNNGAGKTSRQQAVGIAMTGSVPGQGKTLADTYKLCGGEVMTAGLVLEDFMFSRVFRKTTKADPKNGANTVEISQEIMVSPGKGEKNSTQKQARILAEVGNFPVMLDFSEFIKLSDNKRRDFIYNLSPIKSSSWTRESIETYLEKQLLTLELKTNNPDKYAATSKTIEETMAAYPTTFDVHGGLTAMIDFVKGKLSYWNKEKDNAEGAVNKLMEIKNELEETDRNIAANKKTLEELQQKLTGLTAQISADTVKQKAQKDREERIKTLKAEILAINTAENPHNLADLQDRISIRKTEFKPVFDYNKHRAGIQNEIINTKVIITDKEKKEKDIRQVIANNTATLNGYKQSLDSISALNPDDRRCVIHCKIKCDKDFTNYTNFADGKIPELQGSIDDDTKSAEALAKEIENLKKKVSDLEKKKEKSFRDESTDKDTDQEVRDAITLLETKVAAAKNFTSNQADKAQIKQEELDRLEQTPYEPIIDLESAEAQKAGYETQISDLKTKIGEQEKAKITKSNLQAALIDNKHSVFYAEAYKFISDLLGPKGIQGNIVKSVLAPIQQDIQEKFIRLGIDHEFFFSTESDTGKEVFQFGWITTVEDKWAENGTKQEYRNFDALSTGEQLLLLSALMTTIIERSNPRLKLLAIDNVNDLDRNNFEKVMYGLSIIGDKMDNIILSGVVEQYLKIGNDTVDNYQGFKVWDLSKKVEI